MSSNVWTIVPNARPFMPLNSLNSASCANNEHIPVSMADKWRVSSLTLVASGAIEHRPRFST